jgi:hypothetical protein
MSTRKREPRELFLHVFSRRSLFEPEFGRVIFDAISDEASAWNPRRWDVYDPVRRLWDPARIDEVWKEWELICLSREPGVARIEIKKRWERGRSHGQVRIEAAPSSVDPAGAVRLLERISRAVDADFAYLHLAVPEDQGQLFGATTGMEGEARLSVPAWILQAYLPGIFWGTVLGPPYTRLFGAERVRTVPAHTVREVGPDRWYIQLTPLPQDNRTHHAMVARAREKVVSYLGAADAFWRPGMGRPVMGQNGRPVVPGRAPSFEDLYLEESLEEAPR